MRSALSEAIERCFSSGDQRKDVIVGKQTDLLKKKDINIISGARDTYTKKVYTEWINASDLLSGDNIYLPAEVAFFNYTPKQLKIRLFSLSHTTGMATGVTFEDAALSGILEAIERDAYWITMRCKINCPDIDLRKINYLSDKVLELVTDLNKCGFDLSIKDMSLDWDIPVAHVVLKDKEGKIPCFAHGSGAGLDWAMAVSRAVAEAVQMYLGMKEFASVPDNWEQVISTQGNLGSGVLSWSDPLFEVHMGHLLDKSFSKFNSKLRVKGPIELLNILRKKGYSIIVAPINYIDGLKTVRVYIPEATQPDERLERISCRLIKYKNKLGLKSFYSDPILT
jgi:thiazole/oxazole-forming peptide maturase SagD family component